jgi:hypothetical protein
MTLLLRDPDAKAGEPSAPAPPEAAPEVRACPTCQAPLEPEQDWCLSCGAAQPGRLAGLPGRRAAATVLALTAVLVGGAVAASYAALQDGGSPAGPATTPTQLAQVPPPPAAAPVDPAAAAPSTATPPPPTDTGSVPVAPSAPVTPPATPAPAATTPPPAKSPATTPSTTKPKAETRTTTTPTTPAAPAAIKLADTAAALYDPYHRDTAAGDPTKALDGTPTTSFAITVADGSQTVGAGLVVDLGKLRGVRELDLTTKTPGFRVEIYATDSEELPADVLDTRWAHVKDASDVGADGGTQTVALGGGSTKYRRVLLWFTTPPTDGLTVRVSELKVLG